MKYSATFSAILILAVSGLPNTSGVFFRFPTVGLLNGLANQAIKLKGKIGVSPTAFCYLDVRPSFTKKFQIEYTASLWCPVVSAYARTSSKNADKFKAIEQAVNSYAKQSIRYGQITQEQGDALIQAYLDNPSNIPLF